MAEQNRRRAFALALALAAAPGIAERLPLKGDRWIEVRGDWRIDGERVVFTSADGALRSIALAETALGDGVASPSAPPGQVEAGAPLSFSAWPKPEPLPEIRPLPAPAPSPGRQAPRFVPAGCRLTTAGPGDEPTFLCPGALVAPVTEEARNAPLRLGDAVHRIAFTGAGVAATKETPALDRKLLFEAFRLGHCPTFKETVNEALAEYVAKRRRAADAGLPSAESRSFRRGFEGSVNGG